MTLLGIGMFEEKIIGHKRIIDYFKLLYKNGRLSSAYLFIGKEGIGKRKVARFIAKFLNCQERNKPCFSCSNCYKIERRMHPDVLEIYPKNSIGIQDIREIQKKVYLKSFSSPYKVIIIDDADTLTQDAANAFLRTLEEPPQDVFLFLITSKPENLLPTIKSRTQKIWFSLKFEEIKEYLLEKDISVQQINLLLRLSEGKLSIIDKLRTEKYKLKREKILKENFSNIYESNRKSLKETLLLIIYFLRDCLFFKIGSENSIINFDLKERILNYQRKNSIQELMNKINELLLVNNTLDNINVNLANNLIRTILH